MAYRADQVELYVRDLAERLGPGSMLPGERELASSCGVSRMTVRRALEELELRRIVERRHGAGTFVRHPNAAQPLMATSFHEDMRRRGYEPSSRLISSGSVVADEQLASRLETEPGAEVLIVRRLRLADGIPMALETLHVPESRAPGLTGQDLVENSFYRVLRERFGRQVARGRQTVQPVVLDAADARVLQTDTGAPALRFVRVSRDQLGEVVEHVDAVYRGDRYLIEVALLPPGEGRR